MSMNDQARVNETNIFEKIIAREIPASIVYEDETVISFLDIKPINKGHALIVPKKKFVNIFDADPETLGHMIQVAQTVARALREATGAEGINILMNNEKAAGQDVFHAHLHVVPRFKDDGALKHAHHTAYGDGEMALVAEKLKTAIA